MKKIIITSMIITMVVGWGTAFANPDNIPHGAKMLGKLNIIGVDKDKNANMDNAGGSVIFVPLTGKTKIMLQVGEDFAVLDKNGTDGSASFQLPDPDLDPYLIGEPGDAKVLSAYSVYVRPLGKPGGWSTITTCADLVDTGFAGLLPGSLKSVLNRQEGTAYCSIEQVGSDITLRTTGKNKKGFQNVTAELLTIVFRVEVDIDPDPAVEEIIIVCVRVPIFDDIIENEYWEYDNNGLKLLQVRFYDVPTDVSAGDGDLDGC